MENIKDLKNQKEELENQLKVINEQIKEKESMDKIMDVSIDKFIKVTSIPYVGKTFVMKVKNIYDQTCFGPSVMITDNFGYQAIAYDTLNIPNPNLFEYITNEKITYTIEIIDNSNKIDELLTNNNLQIQKLLNV